MMLSFCKYAKRAAVLGFVFVPILEIVLGDNKKRVLQTL